MTARRKQRDPYTRTVVRLPERALAESILHLAAPLLDDRDVQLVRLEAPIH